MHTFKEQMIMEREPVHPKCLGQGFTEEEKDFIRAPRCPRIEPIDVFEIIDEETGQVDPETATTSVEDEACRCTAYVNPSNWWRNGRHCPLGEHYRPDLQSINTKVRAGQQKQKKKGRR